MLLGVKTLVMHFKSIINNTSKFLLVLFIFQSNNLYSQLSLNRKINHSFGISVNNNIYFPEKIFNEVGIINRAPTYRYGYEINVNYNLIFKNRLGIKSNIILFGSIPDGFRFNIPDEIENEFTWSNGSTTYSPFDGHQEATSGFITGIPYWGFDLLFNYSYKYKNIIIQPEIGARFMYFITTGNDLNAYFCYDNINCELFHYEFSDNLNNERILYPDLVFNLNLLLPIKSNHHLKIGISFNYGFVPRMEGYYEIVNVGKYNSSGNMEYGSTYFGFNVGYQFLGLEKRVQKKKSYLFNPKF